MKRIALFGLVAVVALGAGCGDDDNDGNRETGDSGSQSGAAMKEKSGGEAVSEDAAMKDEVAMKSAGGRTIKVVTSDYGRVIADGSGEAFYLFGKEDSARSECFGACARAWPPVLTKGSPRAGKGAKANLLGTTKRPGGKLQVTYAGHPLYYYVDDSPGNILCQNVSEFGGLWLVVKPSGAPVT